MGIKEYIQKIKKIIVQEEEYDSYRYIFKEYIQYLENLLKREPDNIKAICQLAIAYFEDRRDTDICIDLMEAAQEKYESSMPKDSLCELLNNLAYFYDYEIRNKPKAIRLLKKAIKLNSRYQKSYYALAYLCEDSKPKFALKILNLMPKSEIFLHEYQFLFAYVLAKNNLFNEALEYLEPLIQCDKSEIAEKALYFYAVIKSIIGSKNEACIIADKLYKGYKEGKNNEILTFELIYLFFQLQDYEKVAGLFGSEKTEKICIDDTSNLNFYALKMLGLSSECQRVYSKRLKEINEVIEEIKTDKEYTKRERSSFIAYHENDIKIITQHYNDIILNNKTTELDDVFCFCKPPIYCYLIDCPRHS